MHLLFLFTALVAITSSTPLPSPPTTLIDSTALSTAILTLSPTTSTCTTAAYAAECRTAAQAAPYIALSWLNYNISSFSTQAALLSLQLYETAGFKYAINHYPGVPGQGTRNMQNPAFNVKYAEWIAAEVSNGGITGEEVQAAQQQGPVAVLGLVNGDFWGFASAAWFLSTQCEASYTEGLASGSLEGWEGYLTGCVGTTATDDRTAIWKQAVALGKW